MNINASNSYGAFGTNYSVNGTQPAATQFRTTQTGSGNAAVPSPAPLESFSPSADLAEEGSGHGFSGDFLGTLGSLGAHTPTEPLEPIQPHIPTEPTEPIKPHIPTEPLEPIKPRQGVKPPGGGEPAPPVFGGPGGVMQPVPVTSPVLGGPGGVMQPPSPPWNLGPLTFNPLPFDTTTLSPANLKPVAGVYN